MTLFIVVSDDPDTTEDAYAFSDATMLGNKWSSNTGGMVSLAVAYDTQTVVQPSGDRTLELDIDGRWTGLTLAYTQQLSGYSGVFGGDAYINTNGDGTGRICYTNTQHSAEEKNWLKVYAQWPSGDVGIANVRATLTVGGVSYAEVLLDQSQNGGSMNLIYNITTQLPPGSMSLCIYDNPNGPVFADAVRFDYSLGEQGFVTFTRSVATGGYLKALKTLTFAAQAYIITPGESLFQFIKTCQANAILARPQDKWASLEITQSEWTTEKSSQ
jgi:hypothetical protein